jgi:hypothetical protein
MVMDVVKYANRRKGGVVIIIVIMILLVLILLHHVNTVLQVVVSVHKRIRINVQNVQKVIYWCWISKYV